MFPIIPGSFGDIVAATKLALTIYKTLSDSTGSSFEYQCLMDELHSFHHALFVSTAQSMQLPSAKM
jgi:hypothetical protein